MTKPGRPWSPMDLCWVEELGPVDHGCLASVLTPWVYVLQGGGDSRTKTLPCSGTKQLMPAGDGT